MLAVRDFQRFLKCTGQLSLWLSPSVVLNWGVRYEEKDLIWATFTYRVNKAFVLLIFQTYLFGVVQAGSHQEAGTFLD